MSHSRELIIEKNVLPKRLPPIPFDEMEITDSVLITFWKESDIWAIRQRVRRKHLVSDKRFSTEKISDNQMRVYRIK